MISLPSSFPRRVRIHGGGFDASARAMHRNAANENVSFATIERTKMSTKTTLKRVSLVAVAALGFGLLSVVPSSATSQADTLTLSAATSSATIGTPVTVTVNQSFIASGTGDSLSVTASLVSSPASSVALPILSSVGVGNTNGVPAASGQLSTLNPIAAGYTTGITTVSLTPTHAGTYVIKLTPAIINGGGTLQAVAVTWTVTVAAVGAATAADSTSFLNAGEATAATSDATVAAAMTLNATAQAASIVVTPKNAALTNLTSTAILSVSIAGPGSLGISDVAGVASQTATGRALTGTAGQNVIGVFSDGTSGVATITVAIGTTVISTETVTFSGALASFTATPVKTVIGIGSTDTVAITGKDAAGVSASVGTYYATSATPAVATVAISGTNVIVTGVAVGTSVITIGNAATSPTVSTTFTVTVGKTTIGTLTMTTDKASYAAGEKVTLTVHALGSNGTAVGDGTYATTFSSTGVTSNIAVTGATLPVASVAFVGGVATYVIYAPVAAATVTLTGTEGASTDSTTKGTVSVSFDVTSPGSDAATDAANAATDAANYAADAADAATTAAQEATAAAVAAQESADAATAAVVALGLRVDTLLASVRAQLTSLKNLIIRIIKKTKA